MAWLATLVQQLSSSIAALIPLLSTAMPANLHGGGKCQESDSQQPSQKSQETEPQELPTSRQQTPDVILFIGNPGVGKSTLLNGLLGKTVFKSGTSYGTGLTDALTVEHQNGKLFMDVPGVADCNVEMQVKAAKAIAQALSYDGNFHIFFVVGLEAGRVRTDDVSLMKIVLESAPIKEYGIIINQLGRSVQKVRDDVAGGGPIKARLMGEGAAECFRLPISTNRFYCIERREELEDEDNVLWEPVPVGFRDFIDASPGQLIPSDAVKTIRLEQLDSNVQFGKRRLHELFQLLYCEDSGYSSEAGK